MNIKLEITDPFKKVRSDLCAVYRIDFDNGKFYIGSSADMYGRARTWQKVLSGIAMDRFSYKHIPDKVTDCTDAKISVVRYVKTKSYLLKAEQTELKRHTADPNLINVFHYTKCEVIQFKDGIEIGRYPSIKKAAKILGANHGNIRDAMTGRKTHWHGFTFRYADRYANDKNTPRYIKQKVIRVNQFSTTGEFIRGYKSQREAAKAVGVNQKGVYRALSGEQKTTGGYVFKYA